MMSKANSTHKRKSAGLFPLRSTKSNNTEDNTSHDDDDIWSIKLLRTNLHPHVLSCLQKLDETNDEESGQEDTTAVAVVFIVCLMDALHRSLYPTFLSRVLFDKITKRLLPPTILLQVDFEVYATNWRLHCNLNHQQQLSWRQPIDWDYDGGSSHVLLHEMAGTVIRHALNPREGLQRMEDYLVHHERCGKLEKAYRDLPLRVLVIPFMAATCSAVFFEGNWADLAASFVLGLVAGTTHWICAMVFPDLKVLQEFLIATLTGMGAVAAVTIAGVDRACFVSQVCGTLYWFLVGTAFVLSIYELTNQQLAVGAMRFVSAVLNSTILGFGVILGVWLAAYGGPDRYERIVHKECRETVHDPSLDIHDAWFLVLFPVCGLACAMQFKISPQHWIQCLIVQSASFGLQYWMVHVWKLPDFVGNLVPAFVGTLVAQGCVTMEKEWRKWRELQENERNHAPKDDFSDPSGSDGSDDSTADGRQPPHEGVDNLIAYHNLDLWYCLIPALYLLVPGASLLKEAFGALFVPAEGHEAAEELISSMGFNFRATGTVGSAVLVIGLAQALGVRCGVVVLHLIRKCCRCHRLQK